MASTAVSMVPCAVRMTTGSSGMRSRAWASTSRPSTSPSRRSSTIASTLLLSTSSSACWPVGTLVTCMPWASRRREMSSHSSRSSSTTSTRLAGEDGGWRDGLIRGSGRKATERQSPRQRSGARRGHRAVSRRRRPRPGPARPGTPPRLHARASPSARSPPSRTIGRPSSASASAGRSTSSLLASSIRSSSVSPSRGTSCST